MSQSQLGGSLGGSSQGSSGLADEAYRSLTGLTLHPLLTPSILDVLLEHLHSQDVQRCRLVCKTWNDLIRKKSSPFLNERVLAIFIKYIPEKSVVPCRLVCSLWNQVIVKSKRWVGPYPEDVDPDYGTFFRFRREHIRLGVGSEEFQRFQAKFGSPSNLPLPLAFTHFIAPYNVSLLNDPDAEDFLRTYGTYIKCLKMHRCKWELEGLRRTLFECTPNLEYLQIVSGIIPGTQIGKGKKMITPELDMVLHEDPTNVPVLHHMKSITLDMNLLDTKDNPRAYVERFLSELFSSTPNLQGLNVSVSSWYARTWVTDLIATNDNISLKHLQVLEHMIDPDLTKVINLQMKQLPLTTLKIRIRFKDVTLEALHELFVSLKHTLTFLQLIFVEYKCAHEFPSSQELHKLKQLELWKYKGQLDFLKDFASLEKLLIGEMELKGQHLFNQRDIFKALLPNLENVTFKDFWEPRIFS